jgi:hypothetical protein
MMIEAAIADRVMEMACSAIAPVQTVIKREHQVIDRAYTPDAEPGNQETLIARDRSAK